MVVTTIAQLPVLPQVIGVPAELPSANFGTVTVAEPPPFFGDTSLLLAPPSGAQSFGPVSGRPSFAHTATLSVVSETGKPEKETVTFSPPAYGPGAATVMRGLTVPLIALAGPRPFLFTARTM